MLLADSEARIGMLREKAGILDSGEKKKNKKRRDDDDMKLIAGSSSMQGAILPTTNGHINLFEDLEINAMVAAVKVAKKTTADTEKGFALAPSAKDLKPWYSERTKDQPEEIEDEKRKREESRKFAHDPLTSITRELAVRPSTSSSRPRFRPPAPASSDKPPEVQARLSRETSERDRALELIRRKKRQMEGNATPSTVCEEPGSGYGDVFNRREVEEAHRYRDRPPRRWEDEDRSRNRSRRQW
ncbi:hypothetical protein M413DRAFT_23522 [Hebeloma cylindrosporum]|uniref:CBF1-interacting co-repressor CIR N-terminal domain-containing protein n=1 Tax=Hebeloma cylindrosporum TaxID=76867 RepID=A0A0C2Z257_HEBCY|nr:hypothetical protein M413DRAFT_23522 [Hebeloma cylindrosporum h7]